jgi:hypothetical protein
MVTLILRLRGARNGAVSICLLHKQGVPYWHRSPTALLPLACPGYACSQL